MFSKKKNKTIKHKTRVLHAVHVYPRYRYGIILQYTRTCIAKAAIAIYNIPVAVLPVLFLLDFNIGTSTRCEFKFYNAPAYGGSCVAFVVLVVTNGPLPLTNVENNNKPTGQHVRALEWTTLVYQSICQVSDTPPKEKHSK